MNQRVTMVQPAERKPLDGNGASRRERVALGWYFSAAVIAAALLVGEFAGPMVASMFAVFCAAIVIAWVWRVPQKHLPPGAVWLILLFVVGSVSAVLTLATGAGGGIALRDLQRDLLILGSHLLLLIVGYYFSTHWEISRILLGMLVLVGGVVSAVQIWEFFLAVSRGVQDLHVLRLEAGRGSVAQVAAVVAVYLITRGMGQSRLKIVLWAVAAVCLVSITLTLSRVQFASLLIFVIAFSATRLDAKRGRNLIPSFGRAVVVGLAGICVLAAAIYSIQFFSREAYVFVYEGFVEKTMNSWTELFSTSQQSVADINATYRAFEAEKGMEVFVHGNGLTQWIGHGWGTAVDLGLDTASTRDDFVRDQAAFLHNGYVNYLVKTGVIGCGLYVAFLLHIGARAVWGSRREENPELGLARRQALLGASASLALGTMTAGGFGFPMGFPALALLIGICSGLLPVGKLRRLQSNRGRPGDLRPASLN